MELRTRRSVNKPQSGLFSRHFDRLRYVGSIPFFAFLYVIKTQPAAANVEKRVFANGTVTVEKKGRDYFFTAMV